MLSPKITARHACSPFVDRRKANMESSIAGASANEQDMANLKNATCFVGYHAPAIATDVHWFKDRKKQESATRIYVALVNDMMNISKAIDVRNSDDRSMSFDAFNPKHLELSISL